MNIKTKTIAAALSLALVVGLSPAAAFAAPASEGAIAPAQAPALQTQKVTDVESATEAMVKTCDALPAPSKVKFSDNKKVLKAMNAIGEFYVYGDEEGVTDEQQETYATSISKFEDVYYAMQAKIDKSTKKTKALKVKGVKVTPGKKKATVKWKKLTSSVKWKYQVYYSLKKAKGYKKAGTTAKAKLVVKNLKPGTKYYFKVRAVRTDIPEYPGDTYKNKVYTKYSKVVAKSTK